MAQGNPNPSPSTRFGAERGPAPGKTSKQKKQELKNAEMAISIRGKILKQLEGNIDNQLDLGESADAILDHLNSAVLKMLKDAEDRGLGAPTQDHTSSDGSMSPVFNTIYEDKPKGRKPKK